MNLSRLETKIITNESGEIKEKTVSKTFKAKAEPTYIKIYLEDITYLDSLNIKSDLLYELLKYVTYDHEIMINKTIKQRIASRLDKSLSHVNNTITKLVKNEILIRIDTGLYQLNTFLFAKGSWKDISTHRENLKVDMFYNWKNSKAA